MFHGNSCCLVTAQLTVICLPKYSQINDIVLQWPHVLKKKGTFTDSCTCDSSVIQPMHEAVICRKSWSDGTGYGIGEFWKKGGMFAMQICIPNSVMILFDLCRKNVAIDISVV